MKWDTTFITEGAANLTPKKSKEILKESLNEMMEEYYEQCIPKKFSPNASAVYNFSIRSPRYIARAKKENPGWQPMILTGTLALAMTSGNSKHISLKNDDIKATLKMKRGHATLAVTSAELSKVNQNEISPLMVEMKNNYIDKVSKLPPQKENI